MCAACPADVMLPDLIILIIYLAKSSSYEAPHYAVFSSVPHYFILLGFKCSPQHPVLKHPQSIFFPLYQNQVSRPCKTTGKYYRFDESGSIILLDYMFNDINQGRKVNNEGHSLAFVSTLGKL
jgi:hypothetical protein